MLQTFKDSIDGVKLNIKLEQFTLDGNLELFTKALVTPYATDGQGNPTTTKIEEIDAIEADPDAKARAMQRWLPYPINYNTVGKFVDVQGNEVAPETEGAIPERLFWYNIPATSPAVPQATTVGQIISALILEALNGFKV